MIGLALVTLVASWPPVCAADLETPSTSHLLGRLRVTSTNNFSPIATASSDALRGVPGVQVVSGVRAGQGKAFGGTIDVIGVDGDITGRRDHLEARQRPRRRRSSATAARS